MKKSAENSPDDTGLLLKASAKLLFETLMEQTADRIYIKDLSSRFISCSAALAKGHSYESRHELEGMTDFDLFSNEHAQQAFDDEQEIIRSGKPLINKVEKETWEDGSITWVSSSKAPLYLSSGKLAGIIGISRDVTSEKIAQEKLATSESRLREQNAIMRSDYESARKVQSVMIPGRIPNVRKLEIAYLWKPMAMVGGDMINFPRNPSNYLLFFMGDVCGHGATAAFYTVLLKYLTSHSAEVYNNDPQSFLNSVNQQVIGRINNGFVTGLAGHFSPADEDGSRQLILSHAGHRQILIYRRAARKVELIDLPNGTVMGFPGIGASQAKAFTLNVGDRFYAFTDGIVEASNTAGEEFGMLRLIELFETLSDLPTQKTLDAVHTTVQVYTESPDQQDDVSILGFEIND
ncbi:MAG: sigma-B regulation protein RsbU (phosphoserine phosphatase) [Lentimonas sp.]|jgi:sigma-B regulation protein RsbU (phosphoserine phosphatase)